MPTRLVEITVSVGTGSRAEQQDAAAAAGPDAAQQRQQLHQLLHLEMSLILGERPITERRIVGAPATSAAAREAGAMGGSRRGNAAGVAAEKRDHGLPHSAPARAGLVLHNPRQGRRQRSSPGGGITPDKVYLWMRTFVEWMSLGILYTVFLFYATSGLSGWARG